jgi:hypothetical protein
VSSLGIFLEHEEDAASSEGSEMYPFVYSRLASPFFSL